MNIREYWQGVRRVAESLPDTVFVISQDKPDMAGGVTAGRISECDRMAAAQLIHAGTHKQATPEEIEAYKAEQAEARKAIQKAEYDRRQQFALPEDLANLVKAAVTGRAKRE